MHDYKKLNVWKNSMKLVSDIYNFTKKFPKEEVYALTSQIRRGAISIPSNISEGAGRSSEKEFNNFLSFSYGSTCELETQLLIAKNLDYISDIELDVLLNDLYQIQKMIFKLKEKLN